MNIDEQIQALIDDAPNDGSTPMLVEAIAPVLKSLAAQLRYLKYYIVQTLDQNWAFTTLSNQAEPGIEKRIIYAYASLKDVAAGPYPMQDPGLIALPTPVTHILFQMLAMDTIDSIIFFESPGNVTAGTEIQREEFASLIQAHIQQTQAVSPTLPPDIA